ncbi:hypothetical protein EVAR_40929_1 [Eumeta japonica]|uniref:Uncharacterized protein n=1 Tax=Eumeta variegata TaxID=151549 RepID=A0A4C1X5D1_EUMVA|nr:hypothetical protein EVAR_40929_1 [Eumeta japonica]
MISVTRVDALSCTELSGSERRRDDLRRCSCTATKSQAKAVRNLKSLISSKMCVARRINLCFRKGTVTGTERHRDRRSEKAPARGACTGNLLKRRGHPPRPPAPTPAPIDLHHKLSLCNEYGA